MQDFLHASHDEALQAVERFEKMVSTDKVEYFDVHQIESIYDYYLEKNDIKQAEKILSVGLSQHPNASSLQVKQAILIADHGDIDVAHKMLLSIIPIESTNVDAFMSLGWIMLQKNNYKQAISYFNKAVDISFEDKNDILLEITYNLNQYELYLESINFLERLLENVPDHENALFEYAFSLDKILEYEKSINAYQKLLSINPFSENGWYNLGIIYNKLGNFLEANKAYDFTLAINPQHEEAYFNKGNSLVQSGCFKEAIEAYIEHTTMCRDAYLTYQCIADCWEQLKNFDMAIRFYQLVIKMKPKQGDAWYGMGTTLMETENYQSGLQAIDQAITINPLNADYWFAHARGLFELDKAEDASRSLENGLNLDPHELTGWFELLKLKMILNKEFPISAYVDELCEQYEHVAAVHYLSAVAYYHYLENKTEGVKAFKVAFELDPDGMQDVSNDYPEIVSNKEILQIINSKQ